MSSDLLEIQPRELNFIFELKKQSSCSIRLVNKSKNHVAFKVKTTSPKKYCVRPNIGIIKPKSTCDFTVTMQAQKVAPPDMVCKDKFLVQGTIVPAGTTEEDILPGLFAKEDGRFVEENKLKVILVSPPNSPVLSPINGTLKQVPDYEASILKDQVKRKLGSFTQRHMDTKDVEFNLKTDDEVKPEKGAEYTTMKQIEEPATGANYKTVKEVEEPAMDTEFKTMKGEEEPAKNVEYAVAKDTKEPTKSVEYATSKDTEEPAKDGDYKKVKDLNESAKGVEYKTSKDIEEPAKVVDQKTMKDIEEPAKGIEYKMKNVEELKLVKDIDEMKSKLNVLESKLSEAEVTISKLTAERRWTVQERESLQQELAVLRRKGSGRKVQVGFPLLYVCMVALVSVVLGYLIHC